VVYYHIAVDRVVLERSLDTRLSVYTVYSVESKHTVKEGGGRGNTTLLDTYVYTVQCFGSKHTERGWGERVCKVTRLLDVEDRDAQWRVVFAHRG
jgi:hypothetical protein